MKGWLLDTSVVKQLAPGKQLREQVEPNFSNWLRLKTDDLYLSATTIVDVSIAIGNHHVFGRVDEAMKLRAWLGELVAQYGERILRVNADVGIAVGVLVQERVGNVEPVEYSDVLIGGTARAFDLDLLTRRKAAYAWMNGLTCLDPFVDPLPE